MFRNYLKIALRTLWKNKKLTTINVFGLATGMACTLLIFLFIQDELSYDRFHADALNIHRVVKDFINDDGSRIPDATTPAALAPAMGREIPEVLEITRVHPDWGGTNVVEYNANKTTESGVWRVDSTFFNVFSFKFIKGDPRTALSDINSIILTQSTAMRYFGDEDPIGKTLNFDRQTDFTVTAVIQDVPGQSHFHFNMLQSFRRLNGDVDNNWGGYNYYTYVKVKPGTDLKAFEDKIQAAYERNQEERYSDYYTQPLLDIHLKSHLKWELEPNGDQLYIYVFLVIGLFILVIAAINYINLSTAKSSLRAKETGIRKVSGAQRTSLVLQFLLESLVLCTLSAMLALTIAYAFMPLVNEFTQKQLQLDANPIVIIYLVMTTLFIGVVAGIFPALYLSSFKPIAVLKGLKLSERGALGLRKSLVVVQFTISITLIISTLIIARQMNYLQSSKLGLDKDHVVVITSGRELSRAERNGYLNAIKALPEVKSAAFSGGVLGRGFSTTRLSAEGSDQQQQLNFSAVGYDYLDVVGIQVKEGRGFSNEFPADSLNNGISGGPLDQRLGGIIINERAVKEYGLGYPAAGKRLIWSTDADTTYYVDVVGVVKDFNFTSLRNEIKPFGFLMIPGQLRNLNVKLSGKDIPATLAQLEHTWKSSFPDVAFEYTFMDETFASMYKAEERFQTVFITLVVLGIIISCLGLFALAAFSSEQRIKEISIRKVLGASVGHLVGLLSRDFLKLIIIAVIIATPIAGFGMNKWLEGFAYHVTIEWWLFLVSAAIALLIAFLTISTQAIKAALTNPASNLRSE